MIDAEMRTHILDRLRQTAAEEKVRILYAAESGSRAWGFASPDSDYDVRFIYAHETAWYLSLDNGRDVIERPLDDRLVDLAGWDARKALNLLLKSNPALYEWMCSPIVYIDDGVFRAAAKALFERNASPRTLAFHYASIAGNTAARHLANRTEVNLKRYFYVLRPLLSLEWVSTRHTSPPMNITELMAGAELPPDCAQSMAQLIALKQATPELGTGPRISALDEWIEDRLAARAPARLDLPDHDRSAIRPEADRLFRSTIGWSVGV